MEQAKQPRPEFAYTVVRFFGICAVIGWLLDGVMAAATAMGVRHDSGLLLAIANLALLPLIYLSALGTCVAFVWAVPCHGRRLGAIGYVWIGVTVSFFVVTAFEFVRTVLFWMP